MWDKYQNQLFINFLKTVGLSHRNADMTPLLVDLKLDGYENIRNSYDQSVHRLIVDKVRRKLGNTAAQFDEDWLMEISSR